VFTEQLPTNGLHKLVVLLLLGAGHIENIVSPILSHVGILSGKALIKPITIKLREAIYEERINKKFIKYFSRPKGIWWLR
jgi:hypothetical protein